MSWYCFDESGGPFHWRNFAKVVALGKAWCQGERQGWEATTDKRHCNAHQRVHHLQNRNFKTLRVTMSKTRQAGFGLLIKAVTVTPHCMDSAEAWSAVRSSATPRPASRLVVKQRVVL
jgi:hypothetical protein